MAENSLPALPPAASLEITLRPGNPDFLDLPWSTPLADWCSGCPRLEEAPKGLSRHPIVFANYDGVLYALKELPQGVAEKEYQALLQLEEQRLPAVTAVGYVQNLPGRKAGVLITRYLDRSLPYRSVFMRSGLSRYRMHLLDAMAGLLVQLHLAGIFWGDCSLSNTLFRRDAGALQAYLVDAETTEIYPPRLSPTLRHHDLEIMEENVDRDLGELMASGELAANVSHTETGAYVRQSYQNLWQEITRELIISAGERYRIQERIRALNALGFSVGEMEMLASPDGDKLRLRVMVADRNFHRDQLLELTGLEAEEMQARQMMNEIHEIKASLSQQHDRPTPLSTAAYHWTERIYEPVLNQLRSYDSQNVREAFDPAEMYCQILEHKWYLSEAAQHDVGHQAAVEDYIQRFSPLP